MMAKMILEFEKPIYELEQKILEMKALSNQIDISKEIEDLRFKVDDLKRDIYKNVNRWQRVQIARHPDRPQTSDYINGIFDDFIELHGDRKFKDDPSIIGGMATLNGKSVMVVGHQKGKDTKSNLYRNFGMPNPEGYRKAARLFKLAEKFNKPIITFLDTPGAYPGLEAEERGQAEAIAANLLLMAGLKTPIIIVIIGEGASGGAIGIGIGDRILMLENSWYSVISPESCSSILWRNWDNKEKAAEALKLTAVDLKEISVIDRIIEEPLGGAHNNQSEMLDIVKNILIEELAHFELKDTNLIIKERREKFYNMGVWDN
ncbi:MAG TPA: acetyl-CoA carboxylase carboxyltransferase subunit alpha [Candidatus Kapabacteria bacterium]|nr:acetyl-CoA carboxylase carboxyltransferase subunit alpha [Candidatus Kapabacteria bacterium]